MNNKEKVRLFRLLSKRLPKPKEKSRVASLLETTSAVVIGVSLGYLQLHALALFETSSKSFGVHNTQIYIGAFFIAIGVGASIYKLLNKVAYGVVEIIFGSVSAIAISFTISTDSTLAQLASLVGSSYVIATGMENVFDACKEQVAENKARKPSPEMQQIMAYLHSLNVDESDVEQERAEHT